MKKTIKPGGIFAILLVFLSIAPFCYALGGIFDGGKDCPENAET